MEGRRNSVAAGLKSSWSANPARTNFMGALFAFNRNRALSAKHVFATHLPKPPFNRNEFGGSLGGPVVRNKLFFFGNYEGLSRRVSTTTVHAMPTLALKAGDFSGLPAIRDPFTQAPFPNNRIPNDRISGVARELLKFTSDPNGPGNGRRGPRQQLHGQRSHAGKLRPGDSADRLSN